MPVALAGPAASGQFRLSSKVDDALAELRDGRALAKLQSAEMLRLQMLRLRHIIIVGSVV